MRKRVDFYNKGYC